MDNDIIKILELSIKSCYDNLNKIMNLECKTKIKDKLVRSYINIIISKFRIMNENMIEDCNQISLVLSIDGSNKSNSLPLFFNTNTY